ncbi:DNA gyrase inhibitor YacG [Vibrio sp. PP-XX7]
MNHKSTVVKCPQCRAAVTWTPTNIYRPFCSKKCQMIDFGTWADEENTIPGAPDMSDVDGWSDDLSSY